MQVKLAKISCIATLFEICFKQESDFIIKVQFRQLSLYKKLQHYCIMGEFYLVIKIMVEFLVIAIFLHVR
jgi:hypothetical protein